MPSNMTPGTLSHRTEHSSDWAWPARRGTGRTPAAHELPSDTPITCEGASVVGLGHLRQQRRRLPGAGHEDTPAGRHRGVDALVVAQGVQTESEAGQVDVAILIGRVRESLRPGQARQPLASGDRGSSFVRSFRR